MFRIKLNKYCAGLDPGRGGPRRRADGAARERKAADEAVRADPQLPLRGEHRARGQRDALGEAELQPARGVRGVRAHPRMRAGAGCAARRR